MIGQGKLANPTYKEILVTTMTTRTDIHRPAEFDPADYRVVDYLDVKRPEFYPGCPIEAYEAAVARWQERIFTYFPDWRTDGVDHRSIHTCNHCGHPGLRWVAVVEHIPTGGKLAFGEQCADRVDLPGRSAFRSRFIKDQAAREAAALEKEASRRAYAEANPDVVEFLTDALQNERETFAFVLDVARKLQRYDSLSEAQTAAIRRIIAKRSEQQAKRDAEPKPEQPLAEGRYLIEGEIVSTKEQQSDYSDSGWTWKMLVKLDDGNKVWGTIPNSLFCLDVAHAAGERVQFTAQVKRSDRDEHFGFFKRPTNARVVTDEQTQLPDIPAPAAAVAPRPCVDLVAQAKALAKKAAEPNDTPVADLTQAQYESLTGRERDAVDRLLQAQAEGRIHEASSANDLTPRQLAEETEKEVS